MYEILTEKKAEHKCAMKSHIPCESEYKDQFLKSECVSRFEEVNVLFFYSLWYEEEQCSMYLAWKYNAI